jgi:hypothetical protein
MGASHEAWTNHGVLPMKTMKYLQLPFRSRHQEQEARNHLKVLVQHVVEKPFASIDFYTV